MKRIIILLACTASVAPSALAQQEAIDQEINRLLSCGCGCFDYQANENMDILTRNLSYSAQKLHRHVNDTTPCAKLWVYGLTQKMLNYADASGYDTVLRYALLYARDTAAQQETIDQEINRLLSCGCGCFDYEAAENMDILTQDLSYTAQKLHRHVNDTTPCTKVRVYGITRRMLSYSDASGYDTVLRYALLYAKDTAAQQETIDQEVNRLLTCGCGCFNYGADENMDILTQDLSYSVQKLHRHVSDTTPCAKKRIYELTQRLLNRVDSSSYDIVFHYNMLYARDTTNKQNYYNSIVDIIRATVLKNIKLPPAVVRFIGSPEFYKATTWELPLLVSYLDMYEEVENLKKWGRTYTLDVLQEEVLTVSLVRLGDSAATQEYIATTPTNSDDWELYILGLNYARTRPATERLISLLDNKEKIEYSDYCYSDDPKPYYTTVRTLALEILAPIIENFPLKRVRVPYDIKLHFSEASEQDIKTAKRWLKKNKNYKIIRQPDYAY